MPEVTVTMNPLELKLFRRALAKAADDGLLDAAQALHRVCELDTLRWDAEQRASEAAMRKEIESADWQVSRVRSAA